MNVALVETPDEGQLLRLVERGELDLSFMLYPLAEGPFVAVELLRDPFLLLVAEDSPLGVDGAAPDDGRRGAPALIAYDRVRDVTRPETHLRGTPRVVFRSNDDETIHGLVASGMGAALLPRLSVDHATPACARSRSTSGCRRGSSASRGTATATCCPPRASSWPRPSACAPSSASACTHG